MTTAVNIHNFTASAFTVGQRLLFCAIVAKEVGVSPLNILLSNFRQSDGGIILKLKILLRTKSSARAIRSSMSFKKFGKYIAAALNSPSDEFVTLQKINVTHPTPSDVFCTVGNCGIEVTFGSSAHHLSMVKVDPTHHTQATNHSQFKWVNRQASVAAVTAASAPKLPVSTRMYTYYAIAFACISGMVLALARLMRPAAPVNFEFLDAMESTAIRDEYSGQPNVQRSYQRVVNFN